MPRSRRWAAAAGTPRASLPGSSVNSAADKKALTGTGEGQVLGGKRERLNPALFHRVVERQRRGELDLLHGEGRAHVGQLDLADQLLVEGVVTLDVRHHHAQ